MTSDSGDRETSEPEYSEPMRVLHVIGRMPGHGAERQLAGMLEAAHGRHWDATLCVLRSGDLLSSQLRERGIPVIELANNWAGDPRRLLQLRSLIGQFDVVHASLGGTTAFVQIVLMTMRNRPVLVASKRSAAPEPSLVRRTIHRAARRITQAYIGNSPDVVRSVCEVHHVSLERVSRVHNGLDTSIFRRGAMGLSVSPSDAPKDAVHAGLPNDHRNADVDTRGTPKKLGAVGRLHPAKGHDVLIAALPKVLADREVTVHIAGQGPLRDDLIRKSAGLPVTFEGFFDQPAQVADFLRSLDLFVMPSRVEGIPNALIEAAACGVPVVATSAPGMAGMSDGMDGVPPDDPDALADAIIRALDDPRVPDIPVASFDEVAEEHRSIFERARAVGSRRAQARSQLRTR